MSDLPAGRELDALVAEKVMDLNVLAPDWPFRIPRYPEFDVEAGETCDDTATCDDVYTVTRDLAFRNDKGRVWFVPNYSTNPAAALLVLEKMEADGYTVTIECRHARNGGYDCHFWRDGNGWYAMHQPTLAQAICAAAKAAKED